MIIHVNAKRWFQKTYGNTYHSVEVFERGKNKVFKVPFVYGYGEHYKVTASKLISENFPEVLKILGDDAKLSLNYWRNLEKLEQNDIIIIFNVNDVNRKKDL